jgi:hypothetical protein
VERCPICRARFKGSPCYRCGTPLDLLLKVEHQAENLLHQGIKALAAGDETQALTHLRKAVSMHRTPLALALLAFVGQAPPDR